MKKDWGLEDPSGDSIEDFRASRDTIKQKVEQLIEQIKMGQKKLDCTQGFTCTQSLNLHPNAPEQYFRVECIRFVVGCQKDDKRI